MGKHLPTPWNDFHEDSKVVNSMLESTIRIVRPSESTFLHFEMPSLDRINEISPSPIIKSQNEQSGSKNQ